MSLHSFDFQNRGEMVDLLDDLVDVDEFGTIITIIIVAFCHHSVLLNTRRTGLYIEPYMRRRMCARAYWGEGGGITN